MKRDCKRMIWLLLVPPAAAIVMGVLMLNLALRTDPGAIAPTTSPLSKTSWRAAPEALRAEVSVPGRPARADGAPERDGP
ncbi:MAG: hypothetical protein AAGG11_01650 [Pseudomonadota bacterium]